MSHTINTWLLSAAFALALAAGGLLDGPSDIQAAQDVATDVAEAQATAILAAKETTP